MKHIRTANPFRKRTQGSALLLAVIIVAVLGAMAANQIRSALTGVRLAESMLFQNSLLNLAEAGAEFALHARNFDDWGDWDSVQNGNAHLHNSPRITLGNGAEGEYSVLVEGRDSANPRIIVESRIFPTGRTDPLTRQITVGLGVRSLFNMQMLSKNEFAISGGANTRLYSFRSDELLAAMQTSQFLSGAFPTDFTELLNSTTFTTLFGSFIRDNASVGSILVDLDAVSIGQADIYGRVATGGEMPKYHEGNAKIHGEDTPSGVNIDLTRIALDFFAQLDPIDVPDFLIGVNYSLPDPSSLTALDGSDSNSIEDTVDGAIETTTGGGRGQGQGNNNNNKDTAIIIGTPDGPIEVYDLSEVDLKGDLYINGPVVLISRGDIKVGNNNLVVTENGSAEVYLAGDFSVSGNGNVNNETQLARNFALFGIHDDGGKNTISLNGNAAMAAAVYAPLANVVFNGGGSKGSFVGAVVGYTITINGGNLDLVYDETLAEDFIMGAMRMEDWRELHRPADRFDFAAL